MAKTTGTGKSKASKSKSTKPTTRATAKGKPTAKKTAATKSTAKAAGSTTLKEGQAAPAFKLPDADGNIVSLKDFKGQKVVLYFYPKDDTPGCTKEACSFRDGTAELKKKKAAVLGVSPDSVKSHGKFRDKFDLNFPLLADEDKKVVQAYGVWKEKSMYGRTYMGVERTTFIIDEKGKIARIFPKVKVDDHLDEVLEAL
ncbi:MAG: thioredoxin-dependent thiol peroxidase [candidate division Zixibacteria bacterium]|nr:thioredoxin-dependent thiol peroxidase [candidate division Zixibacteria bacterium]